MSEVQEKFLKDYTPPAYTVTDVELDFVIEDEYVDVVSIMQIKRTTQEAQNELVLDSLDLELLDIYLNGVKLSQERYKIEKESLHIFNPQELFELTIKNRIYPKKNTELEGLYVSGDILCTQCEPEGFRRITPFIDRPDVMAKYRVSITALKEKFPILLSNGNHLQTQEIGEHICVTWEDPFPKPSYLFALVAGDLGMVEDSFTTKSGKEVALHIYTDKGNESRCLYAMESLKKAMRWDEVVYDREYDLEIYNIVAVDSFNMGAMENKGLNIFNSAYVLADNEVATDRDFMGIESVIAHEYFHNWTGNRITCRDWFQLTLKEGLTVFRDQCFSADMNSHALARIEDVKALRERQFVEDASPMRHPIQPKSYISMNNFYTSTVYEKGAEVIRMIHTLLGEEKFQKGMQIYFDTFDGQAVTTDDFLWAMEQGGGIDLTQFRRWYDQSGTPKLQVNMNYDGSTVELQCIQKVPESVDKKPQLPLYYPLEIALFDEDGTMMLQKQLIIKEEKESFYFQSEKKPVLSLNRNFSAPIIIEYETNYPFLARYETDGFSKYEALHQFGIKTIIETSKTQQVDPLFLETYGAILDDETIEPILKAQLLELPTLNNIIANRTQIEIEYYANGLELVRETIAKQYKEKLLTLYSTNHKIDENTIDKDVRGRRALKNSVLELLASLNSDEVFSLAKQQYEQSPNMGDKLTALKVMDSIDHIQAQSSFESFYNQYHTNSLLMVKYFSILASLDDEFVLQRIKELEKDKAFDKTVPNLVRALYGAFARNLKQFHKADGSGYRFIADKILEIDPINPQMAASLSTTFKLFPVLHSTNKTLMKEELERLLAQTLSSNSFEIISKTLKN